MKWKILSQTVTAGGDPREFIVGDTQAMSDKKLFIIGAERTGGPSDSRMPRRALGTGTDRASARRSLQATIIGYDPSYQLISAR